MDSIPLPIEDLDLDATKLAAAPPSLSASNNNNDHNLLISSPLQKRYTTISIPSTYGRIDSSPAPGTVAGIVIGSVGGVVLILYLTFLALNPGGLARGSASSLDEEVVVTSRRTPSRRGDTIEVVEERDRRDSYRRRTSPRDRDRIIVEESMTGTATSDGRDVVEVFEEESSAISSVSTRPGRRVRSHRSGVRSIDPHGYGGESDVSLRY